MRRALPEARDKPGGLAPGRAMNGNPRPVWGGGSGIDGAQTSWRMASPSISIFTVLPIMTPPVSSAML
jgi:hypothetical protein